MIEDVIYGVMLSANTDMLSKEPPVNALKKLNASFELKLAIMLLITSESVPGNGSWLPKRTTSKIANVYKSFILISFTFNAFFKVLNIKSPRKYRRGPRFSP